MAFGVSRAISAPLLLLNFCMYVIILAIAGWFVNKSMDRSHRMRQAPGDAWCNAATSYFIEFVLIAGVVGVASILSGIHHLSLWEKDSFSGSSAAAFIAWLLTLLAMGFACKEIHLKDCRSVRLKVLEAFVIILAGTQLLYLLSVNAGLFGGEYTKSREYASTPVEEKKAAAAV